MPSLFCLYFTPGQLAVMIAQSAKYTKTAFVGAKYGEVLGVHMLGNPSSEMIYGAAMAIEMEMTLKELEEVVFPHPSVSEIFKESIFAF